MLSILVVHLPLSLPLWIFCIILYNGEFFYSVHVEDDIDFSFYFITLTWVSNHICGLSLEEIVLVCHFSFGMSSITVNLLSVMLIYSTLCTL